MRWDVVAFLLVVSSAWCAKQDVSQWRLVSSANAGATGAQISRSGFDDHAWYHAQVPCTVMACLLQNGLYPDVFVNENLKQVPTAQFDVSWWYRTEVQLDSAHGPQVELYFNGVNYKANVWVNGVLVRGVSTEMATFIPIVIDVSALGKLLAIAVEVFRPYNFIVGAPPPQNISGAPAPAGLDLAITFVDWAPAPPDGNMGLWQSVSIVSSAGVFVRFPLVNTTLSNNNTVAHVGVMVEVINALQRSVSGSVFLTLSPLSTPLELPLTLTAGQTVQAVFNNKTFPALDIRNPVLWWPWNLGQPNMQDLTVSFVSAGVTHDTLRARVGFRQVTSVLDNNHRLFSINGQKVLVRGGGWAPDLFQRFTAERQAQEIALTKDLGLNTIRLEGKFEDDHFYDLCNENGILVMAGWCCCDAWQNWKKWTTEQNVASFQSTVAQAQRLRRHPSVLTFLYSSDELPPTNVETDYLRAFALTQWNTPTLNSAANTNSRLSGLSGVKMEGPYAWVPPNYWLTDTSRAGGAFGFSTEISPGASPMTLESFRRAIPKLNWPIDTTWNYHCGASTGNFGTLNYFTPALNARTGAAKSTEDYLQKAQFMTYEAHRAMFEGYGRNKYKSTGVIQWMLNNPWPSLLWHLYDYYLNSGGAYFGSKKALEPLHVQYSYDDSSVWVVNSRGSALSAARATATVYSLPDARQISTTSGVVPGGSVAADGAVKLLTVPTPAEKAAYFLRLRLFDSADRVLSVNDYVLHTTMDVINWNQNTWYRVPCTSWTNFTVLQNLPRVQLTSQTSTLTLETKTLNPDKQAFLSTVTIKNPGTALAFMVRLRLSAGAIDVAPAYWSDNYFSLLPGETRDITVQYEASGQPTLVVEVFNNISGGH